MTTDTEARLLVALMGLPGAGKSTVAAHLRTLGFEIVNRDALRAERYPALGYTARDKALLNEAVYGAVRAALEHRPVVTDGMTLSRRQEVEALREVAVLAGASFLPLLLQCPPEVAEQRVRADEGDAAHPAADRSAELVRIVHGRFETPPPDAVVLDATFASERVCGQAAAVVMSRLANLPPRRPGPA